MLDLMDDVLFNHTLKAIYKFCKLFSFGVGGGGVDSYFLEKGN